MRILFGLPTFASNMPALLASLVLATAAKVLTSVRSRESRVRLYGPCAHVRFPQKGTVSERDCCSADVAAAAATADQSKNCPEEVMAVRRMLSIIVYKGLC